jgi:hypothetical protein
VGESGNFECEKKNNCLRYFTTLYSIENIIGANYDLTVREFGGRWGGWYKDGKWKKIGFTPWAKTLRQKGM